MKRKATSRSLSDRGVTRARFTAELAGSGQRCLDQAHWPELPVLVLYTSADIVVNPTAAVELARRLPQGEIHDNSAPSDLMAK
ncbi:lysophospholipase [Synechococcus sp. H60.3]|uniref:serine aminopeptidase domain-containing protein n=1 Tax=Synechococcus sp. H60.3 TaxID=2967124 RepID=UPI0039C2AE55